MRESLHPSGNGTVPEARRLTGDALAAALRESRARTWALVDDLTDAQWQVPAQAGINPIAWELAHLAWFAEFWVLRGPHHSGADGMLRAGKPPRHAGPDAHFDSARLPHAQRWRTPLPSREALRAMLSGQLDDCITALDQIDLSDASQSDDALYFHRLALFHEDMHGEAFAWMRAALAYRAPDGATVPTVPNLPPLCVLSREVQIGSASSAQGFAFDNEQPARTMTLADFEIDAAPVSCAAYLRFVEAGGYDQPAFWPAEGGAWRAASLQRHPQLWRHDASNGWQFRWFDHWLPLAPDAPVMHLCAFEAEAYCLWAGRRLPGAAEWEAAAPRLHWGRSVWEWTADTFQPHAGFTPGPYRDYSAPWFGDHRELRGGAFATHQRLHDTRYRNFFQPQRTDLFTGFRTAAL